MKTSWVHGLPKDQQDMMERDFKSALAVRRRLKDLLVAKQDASLREVRSKSAYENPNWAYVQADSVGYERALSEVISLISDVSV